MALACLPDAKPCVIFLNFAILYKETGLHPPIVLMIQLLISTYENRIYPVNNFSFLWVIYKSEIEGLRLVANHDLVSGGLLCLIGKL